MKTNTFMAIFIATVLILPAVNAAVSSPMFIGVGAEQATVRNAPARPSTMMVQQSDLNFGSMIMYGSTNDPASDDFNVFWVQSTDDGETWSSPIRLNADVEGTWSWGHAIGISKDFNTVAAIFHDESGSLRYFTHCNWKDNADGCASLASWSTPVNISSLWAGEVVDPMAAFIDFNSDGYVLLGGSTVGAASLAVFTCGSLVDSCDTAADFISDLNVNTTGTSVSWGQVKVNPDGNYGAIWTDQTDTPDTAYYSRFNITSQAWSAPIQVSDSNGIKWMTNFVDDINGAFNNRGYTHFVWEPSVAGNRGYYYRFYDGVQMHDVNILRLGADYVTGIGGSLNLSIDYNNNIFVLFHHGNSAVDRNMAYMVIYDANGLWSPVIDVNFVSGDNMIIPMPAQPSTFDNNIMFNFLHIEEDVIMRYTIQEFENISGVEAAAPAANVVPDLNLTLIDTKAIGAVDNNFGYDRDLNLTVSFNVIDLDQDDLNFNMWYGASKDAKTTVIVADLNLTDNAGLGDCGSEDWTSTQTCTYDFNIHSSLVADGNYFLTAILDDGTDTDSNSHDVSFVVDNTDPFTYAVDYNLGVWQNNDSSMALTCSDATAGCFITQYQLDTDDTNGVTMGAWTLYSTPITITGDGNFVLDINSSDISGNVEDTNRLHIAIDKVDPFTYVPDYNQGAWQNDDASLTLTCSDVTAGCFISQYTLDSDDSNTVSMGSLTLYTTPIIINTDGNWAVDINSSDISGNLQDVNRLHIAIDSVVPSTTSDANASTWQNDDANIALSCTDSTSGCGGTRFKRDTDDSNTVSLGSYITYDVNMFLGNDGNWAIEFDSNDLATNVESANREYVLIDTNAPVITFTTPTVGSTVNNTSMIFDTNTTPSSIATITVSASGGFSKTGDCAQFGRSFTCDYNNTGFTDGANSITVTAIDEAGNETQEILTFTYNAPAATVTYAITGAARTVLSLVPLIGAVVIIFLTLGFFIFMRNEDTVGEQLFRFQDVAFSVVVAMVLFGILTVITNAVLAVTV